MNQLQVANTHHNFKQNHRQPSGPNGPQNWGPIRTQIRQQSPVSVGRGNLVQQLSVANHQNQSQSNITEKQQTTKPIQNVPPQNQNVAQQLNSFIVQKVGNLPQFETNANGYNQFLRPQFPMNRYLIQQQQSGQFPSQGQGISGSYVAGNSIQSESGAATRSNQNNGNSYANSQFDEQESNPAPSFLAPTSQQNPLPDKSIQPVAVNNNLSSHKLDTATTSTDPIQSTPNPSTNTSLPVSTVKV